MRNAALMRVCKESGSGRRGFRGTRRAAVAGLFPSSHPSESAERRAGGGPGDTPPPCCEVRLRLPAGAFAALAGAILVLARADLGYVAVLLAAVLPIAVAALFVAVPVIGLRGFRMVGIRVGIVHQYLHSGNVPMMDSKLEARRSGGKRGGGRGRKGQPPRAR